MHRMKGYTLNEMPMLAIVFVVLAVTIGLGAGILSGIQTQQCTAGSGTYATYAGSGSVNPVTGTYDGCCTSINASEATDCDTWYGSSSALNITTRGVTGVQTFGTWLPTIAIVLCAAVVIGILLYSFAFKRQG